ncbi:MAG: DUF1573 domain-containing protein [Muribaculaceae bacterium]|nr:DUF1573 domain-containing protein [Muribaculaceae bacterium]
MRKFLLIFIFMIAVMAVLASTELRHDFGVVSGVGGGVSHRFWLHAEGDKSMSIIDIRTSCGCVAGEWDERTADPGDSLYVDVRFDPTGRYGYQEKSVYVATTTGRYRLDLVARVVASDTTLSRYFPYRHGDVSLSASRVEFRGVQPGDSPVEMVEVYNAGVDTLALRIEGPSWLKAHHWRDLLPPGESEPISLQALTPGLLADGLLSGTAPRAEGLVIADTLRIAGAPLPVTLTLDSALSTALPGGALFLYCSRQFGCRSALGAGTWGWHLGLHSGLAHGAALGAALGAGRLSGALGCMKKACGGNATGFGRRGRDSNSW